MNFQIYTLGCKVNQYESDMLRELMSENGFVELKEGIADIYIINSCTVTSQGDKKARQAIGRFKKINPSAIIVLTGCFPQAFPEKAFELLRADIVTGVTDRAEIPQKIKAFLDNNSRIVEITKHSNYFEENGFVHSDKTRAYVKIQDGCDRFCTYCIIPKARGPVRSRTLSDIVHEVQNHALNGHKEVVLVGINLALYGRKEGFSLADAVEATATVDAIKRIRLSSLEPEMLTEQEIERMSLVDKLCPHFHLSVQSGADSTLRRMGRHYDRKLYYEIVQNLRKHFEGCAITTDIMVGFPMESDEDFKESLSFTEKMKYAQIHVFSYSQRAGTKATLYKEQVSPQVKAIRHKKMEEIAKKAQQEFLQNQLGTLQAVLIERPISELYSYGHTGNYVEVRILGVDLPRHEIVKVKIIKVENGYCLGELI